jgi:hypothetical protein
MGVGRPSYRESIRCTQGGLSSPDGQGPDCDFGESVIFTSQTKCPSMRPDNDFPLPQARRVRSKLQQLWALGAFSPVVCPDIRPPFATAQGANAKEGNS